MTTPSSPDPSLEFDTSDGAPKLAPRIPLAGWLAAVFTLMAVVMVPWTVYVAISLPRTYDTVGYDLSWAGFDVGLAIVLGLTGLGLYRRSEWTQAAAVSTATFLVIDAWFDITTAQAGPDRMAALLAAGVLEIPLALLCLLVAARLAGAEGVIRRIAGRAARDGVVPPTAPDDDGAPGR